MASGMATYATDLFDRSTIERLVDRFGRVLDAVVADPSIVVGEIPLLDRGERDLVLSRWAGTDVRAPVGLAPQLLAAAVAGGPDSIAVSTARGRCHTASSMNGRRGWRGS